MTNKYLETPISTAVYQRCEEIRIFNPYQAVPTVMFMEEQVLTRSNGSVLHDKVGTLTKLITDVNETFPIYNPVTQTKVGQDASIGQLYALIWSVYMNEALKRDAYNAKTESLRVSQDQATAAAAAYQDEVNAVNATFTSDDATARAAAEALADTKATEEEKALVMAAYAADLEIRGNALAATLASMAGIYDAARIANAEAAAAAAQAAYDAVMNA